RLRANLSCHGLHALAEIDRRQRDRELAGWVGMNQCLARIAAEIHADGIIDRGDAASAMSGHVSASWCQRRTKNVSRHAMAPPVMAAAGVAQTERLAAHGPAPAIRDHSSFAAATALRAAHSTRAVSAGSPPCCPRHPSAKTCA